MPTNQAALKKLVGKDLLHKRITFARVHYLKAPQSQLGPLIGYSKGYAGRLEADPKNRGYFSKPQAKTLPVLASALGVHLKWLETGEEPAQNLDAKKHKAPKRLNPRRAKAKSRKKATVKSKKTWSGVAPTVRIAHWAKELEDVVSKRRAIDARIDVLKGLIQDAVKEIG